MKHGTSFIFFPLSMGKKKKGQNKRENVFCAAEEWDGEEKQKKRPVWNERRVFVCGG